jgi:hypothetical protein
LTVDTPTSDSAAFDADAAKQTLDYLIPYISMEQWPEEDIPWIMCHLGINRLQLCWLPVEYRGVYNATATYDGRILVGSRSGHVIIIDFKSMLSMLRHIQALPIS